MERYIITWRPFGPRLLVALIALILTILACGGGSVIGTLSAGVAFGCVLPTVRDTRRDQTRQGSGTSAMWLAIFMLGTACLVVARQWRVFGDTDGDLPLVFLYVVFTTVMFMPVAPPPTRIVPRRADGVALRCTKCGYDMEGVPGAVCPECGQNCGREVEYRA